MNKLVAALETADETKLRIVGHCSYACVCLSSPPLSLSSSMPSHKYTHLLAVPVCIAMYYMVNDLEPHIMYVCPIHVEHDTIYSCIFFSSSSFSVAFPFSCWA